MPTPNTENLPLTLVESTIEARDRMKPSDPTREALTPTADNPTIKINSEVLRAVKSTGPLLPAGKEKIEMRFDEPYSLNMLVSRCLYGQEYADITEDQRYFIVTLELALKQKGINASLFEPGQEMSFDFDKGIFSKTVIRDEQGTVSQEATLEVKLSPEATQKAHEEEEKLLSDLERDGILYEALRSYGIDPSYAGRVDFIRQNEGFLDLINSYLSVDSPNHLHSKAVNFGYKESENADQNAAYLQAFLQVKKDELTAKLAAEKAAAAAEAELIAKEAAARVERAKLVEAAAVEIKKRQL